MKTNNPLLNNLDQFNKISHDYASIRNIAKKELFLLFLTILSASTIIAFNLTSSLLSIVSGLIGLILILILHRYNEYSGMIAPFFAITEGVFLSSISLLCELTYPGIVIQAIFITLIIALITALIYANGFIQITDNMKKFVMIALLGLIACYIGEFIFGLFEIYFVTNDIVSIMIDIGILLLAILCLLIDYDEIQQAVEIGVDKEAEWYFATSLLVTLVFLYVRVLQILIELKK